MRTEEDNHSRRNFGEKAIMLSFERTVKKEELENGEEGRVHALKRLILGAKRLGGRKKHPALSISKTAASVNQPAPTLKES